MTRLTQRVKHFLLFQVFYYKTFSVLGYPLYQRSKKWRLFAKKEFPETSFHLIFAHIRQFFVCHHALIRFLVQKRGFFSAQTKYMHQNYPIEIQRILGKRVEKNGLRNVQNVKKCQSPDRPRTDQEVSYGGLLDKTKQKSPEMSRNVQKCPKMSRNVQKCQ